MVLFAVLVGDSSFGRVRADSFQSMMPSSDDLEGILEMAPNAVPPVSTCDGRFVCM